jgi:nucleoside-diphosphate-sugar epimerase
MNILITGGAGFIGRTLYQQLVKKGIHVTLLDKKKSFLTRDTTTLYIQTDVYNQDMMLSLFKTQQFDGIVHLAAVSRVVEAEKNPSECEKTNIGGIYSLLNSIENASQKPWLIFGSSREVYGEQSMLPVKESAFKRAINIYGDTKIKGEKIFTDFAQKYDLNCAIVRFSNVYGNRYDIFDRVIPRFIRAIVTGAPLTIEGGDQLIDFTYIDDTINGLLKVIDYVAHGKNIIDDFHLCPGIGWTLYQLINHIENVTGKKAKIKINPKRNYDVVKFVGDTTKIKNILGLKRFAALEEGISQSIDEYCYDLKGDYF